MLVDIGIKKIKLLTNNPRKLIGLEGYGLEITERIPLIVGVHEDNIHYLTTKKNKMEHII